MPQRRTESHDPLTADLARADRAERRCLVAAAMIAAMLVVGFAVAWARGAL